MKILGTGLTGLVGSRIVELLSQNEYEFENISRSTGVDIANKDQVSDKITHSSADVVLHLAAKADVDGCEKDKSLDSEFQSGNVSEEEIRKQQTAWAINVLGTKHMSDACSASHKKLIYISTDFVFDGEKEESYNEEDVPNPLNWYGQTKHEGEKIVSSLTTDWLILRIAYPYRASFTKNDFVRAVKGRLEKKESVTMVTDHIFTPTYIDDIANAIHRLLMQEATGVFHVVGSSSLSPFEAAHKIASEFGLEESLIGETIRGEFFKDRATRPFRLGVKNDKIKSLGIQMRSFEEGIIELKNQLETSNH